MAHITKTEARNMAREFVASIQRGRQSDPIGLVEDIAADRYLRVNVLDNDLYPMTVGHLANVFHAHATPMPERM